MFANFGSSKVKKCVVSFVLFTITFTMLYMFYTVREPETFRPNNGAEEEEEVIGNNSSKNYLTSYILSNQIVVLLPNKICKRRSFLMILVTSSIYNFENRRTVRETWGGLARNSTEFIVDVYFVIGRTSNETAQREIEREFKMYDDIVQETIVDTYANLSAKSLVMLKVTKRYCSDKTVYFMKTDDDMYVNISPLIDVLSNSSETDLLLGHKYNRPVPKRDPRNKWYVSRDEYAEDYYPNFLSGSAYVMSMDVVHKLYRAAFTIPLYFLEDVYITGMLARAAGVTPQDDTGFAPSRRKIHPCLITTHGYTLEEIRNAHASSKSRKKCEK